MKLPAFQPGVSEAEMLQADSISPGLAWEHQHLDHIRP